MRIRLQIRSNRMKNQKKWPRNNNGNRNRPNPNPQNMGILSFSVFMPDVVATPLNARQHPTLLPEASCNSATAHIYFVNDLTYRFTIQNNIANCSIPIYDTSH